VKLLDHATTSPEKPAVIVEGGQTLSFLQLEQQSAQLANLFTGIGLQRGDNIAILLKNRCEYFVIAWAAQRSGLYYTPVNWHLTTAEASYIVKDCGARILLADAELSDLACSVYQQISSLAAYYSVGGLIEGFMSITEAMSAYPATPRDHEPAGSMMLYSSGTTGLPKGIKRPLPEQDYSAPISIEPLMAEMWGFTTESSYLCPAPLYHSAPLSWSMGAHKFGCTVVLMQKFDPEAFLAQIERYRISHTQCVPTMFVRLLNLPDPVKTQYEISSLQAAIHAAAPCPVHIKEQMLDWWGPIIYEFYSGSEWFGTTAINTLEWLARKGSVGKSLQGNLHIISEDGVELPIGEIGLVYFENPQINFHYHNAPEKTQAAMLNDSWATYGDMGYLDSDAYLYLVDRRTDLIISGGVNIYPSEIENALLQHEAVLDAAVIGVAHSEWGEKVVAVVEQAPAYTGDNTLAETLKDFCHQHIAAFKCPRQIDFAILPRTETGKLQRHKLKAQYAADT